MLIQRNVDAQDVGLHGNLNRPINRRHAQGRRPIGRQGNVPRDNIHFKGLGPSGNLHADVAETDQPERASFQPTGSLRECLFPPVSRSQFRDVVGDAPIRVQHMTKGQLGDGCRILTGAVGHIHTATGCMLHRDRIESSPRPNDER